MAIPHADRRIARTRKALRDALVALILEKGYEAITIQDLIDRADVGRSTFYAHYLDKQQLLLASLAELRAILTKHQQVATQAHGGIAQGTFGFCLAMLEHAEGHAQLYRAMVGKQSGVIVQREIQQILADVARAELQALALQRGTKIPLEVVVHYVVSAFMGLLVWWLDGGLPCTAAEVDRMFQALTIPGVRAALESPEATPHRS